MAISVEISAKPAKLGKALNDAKAAVRNGDWPAAVTIAETALAEGLEDPMLLNLAAWRLEAEGLYVEAGGLLSRALELAPQDLRTIYALGRLYKTAGRHTEALEAFEAALTIDASFVLALREKGLLLEMLGELEAAAACYGRAVEIDPGYADAFAGLASVSAKLGASAAARHCANEALALKPLHSAAICALASVDLAEHDHEGAEAVLRPLLSHPGADPHDRAVAMGLFGDALDGQERYPQAFAAYAAANAAFARLHASRFDQPGVETHYQFVRRMEDWFQTAGPTDWTRADADADPGPARQHIFLVGYLRSATTLLENALAGHPDVCALEEKPTLADADRAFLGDKDGLDRLVALDSGGAAEWRDTYWRRVREHGIEPEGKVFIDKSPAASVSLPMIRKLFPKARILIARRDPRDVVLSCFRHHFVMNPVTYELTDLVSAARHYDALMRLTETYLASLPIPSHVVRYRDLVADFDAETGKVCDFIGVEWSDKVRDFARTARKRNVRSSSAKQVLRPLYSGSGQWRRYRDQLEAVLPVLEPWVIRFGFEPTEPELDFRPPPRFLEDHEPAVLSASQGKTSGAR
jgi:tetratricopeptide (TPR) repeat protein